MDPEGRATTATSAQPGASALSQDLDVTLAAGERGDLGDPAPERVAVHPSDRVDRFVVLERLGEGGMGVVFAAWDPKLERRVALKLVRRQTRPDAHGRLVREAQALARLAHPNVVAVFEVGSHAGAVYIAMEYVEGETLRDWLRAAPRPWTEILAIFAQAGAGLAAAHAAGLIHRDFKPENVLIGTDGRARVLDFGLVRPTSSATLDGEATADGDAGVRPLDPSVSGPSVSGPSVSGPSVSGPEGRPLHPDDFPTNQTLDESMVDDSPAGARGEDRPLLVASTPRAGLSAALTRNGALVGTPRYMAPEQFHRQPADARADQFAFCVALYEALYDQAPFPGERFFELASSVTLGELRPVPRDSPVPASIGRAIVRGLSLAPGDRFDDLPGLLAALEPPQARRRWPWAVASLALAASAAALAGVLTQAEPEPVDPCTRGEAQIERVWSPDRRAALTARFEALDIGFASSSLAAVDEGLAGWSKAWAGAYRSTCETRHEQSPELYDLRMACLGSRREEVHALVELLAEADPDLVRRAPELMEELPGVETCGDVERLRSVPAPDAAHAQEVAAVREALARLHARIQVERVDDALARINQLQARAQATAYEPLIAEVMFEKGWLLGRRSEDAPEARALLLDAHVLALGLGDVHLALAAATKLIGADNFGPGDQGLELTRRWNAIGSGLAHKLGRPPALEYARRRAFSRELNVNMRYDDALVEARAVVELAERSFGPDALRTGAAYAGLALVYGNKAEFDEAQAAFERGYAIYSRRLGPNHPLLTDLLLADYSVNLAAGRLDNALATAERMRAITEVAFGPTDGGTIEVLQRLAIVRDLRGENEPARELFETILARIGQAQALTTRTGVEVSNSLCFAQYKLGELAAARATCARTLAAAEQIVGDRHVITAIILNNLALIARAEGDPIAGLELDRRALDITESTIGPDHPLTAYSLVGLSEGLLATGQGAAAIDPLTRALAIRTNAGDPGELGEAECLLARALTTATTATQAQRERADTLARAGLEHLREAGPNWDAQARRCAVPPP